MEPVCRSAATGPAPAAANLPLLLALLVLLPAAGWTAPTPLGDAFLLNPDDDCAAPPAFCSFGSPVAVGSPGGRFLVSFLESIPHGQPNSSLLARVYRPSGVYLRPEVELNATLAPLAGSAAGAGDGRGDYLVTWTNGSAQPDGVYLKRLNGLGTASGSPIPVAGPNDANNLRAWAPAITAAPDGNYVVAWASQEPPVTGATTIQALRFAAGDQPAGTPIALNLNAVGDTGPAVCTDSDGNTVAVWVSTLPHPAGQPASVAGVSARRLGAGGAPVGGEIVVAPPTGRQAAATVGCGTRASFLVVWQTDQLPGVASSAIVAQRFSRAGNPILAGRQRIDTGAAGDQKAPALSRAPNGTFIVVWTDASTGAGRLVGRHVDATGAPLSDPFEIGTAPDGSQQASVTHYGTGGNFLVVWASQGQILGRRYAPDATP
jgi:hypothetical protein